MNTTTPTTALDSYTDPTIACSDCGLTMGESRLLGHLKLGKITLAAQPAEGARQAASLKAEFGEYVKWCAKEGRTPMQFSAFKFCAEQEGAGQADEVARLREDLDLANEHLRQAVESIAKFRAGTHPECAGQAGQVTMAEKVTCGGCKGTGYGVVNSYPEARGCSDCNGKGYDWEPTERAAAPAEQPSAQKGGA